MGDINGTVHLHTCAMQDTTSFLSSLHHAALPSITTGLTLSLSLIVAIGAQNTFVLRQGLRREHVGGGHGVRPARYGADDPRRERAGRQRWVNISARAERAGPGRCSGGGWYGAMALRRALAPQALQAQFQGEPQTLRKTVLQVLTISLLNPHVYLDTVILVGAVGAKQAPDLQGWFLVGCRRRQCAVVHHPGLWRAAAQPAVRTPGCLAGAGPAGGRDDGHIAYGLWAQATVL